MNGVRLAVALPSPPKRESHPTDPPKYESNLHLVAAGHPHPWPLTLPSSERAAKNGVARNTVVSLARASQSSSDRRPPQAGPVQPSSPRVAIGRHAQGSTSSQLMTPGCFTPTACTRQSAAEQSKRAPPAGQGYWLSGAANWPGRQLVKPRDLRAGLITSDAGELERRCRVVLTSYLDPELLSRAESHLTPRPQLVAAEFARSLRQLLAAPASGGAGHVAAARAQIEAHCACFLDRVPPSWRASGDDRRAGAVREATSALLAHLLARMARSCFEADAVAAAENLFAQALAAPSVALEVALPTSLPSDAAGAGRGSANGCKPDVMHVFTPPIQD